MFQERDYLGHPWWHEWSCLNQQKIPLKFSVDIWIKVCQAWLINLVRCLHAEFVEWNVPATTGVGAYPCFQKNHVLWGIILILFSQGIQKMCLQAQSYQLKCACRQILKRYFMSDTKAFHKCLKTFFKIQQYISEQQNLITKGAFRHLLKICQCQL